MFWVKTTGYLVLVSIALLNQEPQPQREYTQAEKAVLTELCVTVTLDMLQQDELTTGETCFFTHGGDKGKFVPFRESILKRIKKQGGETETCFCVGRAIPVTMELCIF